MDIPCGLGLAGESALSLNQTPELRLACTTHIYIRKNPQDIDNLGCAAGESSDVGFVGWFFPAIKENIPKTGDTRPAIMKKSLQSEYMA